MHDQSQSSITRAIAQAVCIFLFYTGDAVSRIVHILPCTNRVLVYVFAWIMIASVTINDAYGLGVWDDLDDY
jgi:hypothetical protein